jgi:hypothetical protein
VRVVSRCVFDATGALPWSWLALAVLLFSFQSGDFQYGATSTRRAVQCRRVLKHTYVFGFFMSPAAPERALFEHLQVRRLGRGSRRGGCIGKWGRWLTRRRFAVG